MAPKKNSGLTTSLGNTDGVFDNTSENHIHINESKARLIYEKHVKNKSNGGLCGTFFGLFLTCLIAVLTSTFKDIPNINGSATVIMAFFIVGAVVFFVCSVIFFFLWLRHRKKYNEEEFIAALKNTVSPAKATKSKKLKSSKK